MQKDQQFSAARRNDNPSTGVFENTFCVNIEELEVASQSKLL